MRLFLIIIQIKTGTLAGILKRIASHHGLTVNELLQKLNL